MGSSSWWLALLLCSNALAAAGTNGSVGALRRLGDCGSRGCSGERSQPYAHGPIDCATKAPAELQAVACGSSSGPIDAPNNFVYRSTFVDDRVEHSEGLYVTCIVLLTLGLMPMVCAVSVFVVGSDSGSEAPLFCLSSCGFLVGSLILCFSWLGVMRQYWDGCWGAWNPEINFVEDYRPLMLGVRPESFYENCHAPLKGKTCEVSCLDDEYWTLEAGAGIRCGEVNWEPVDDAHPTRCMPSCFPSDLMSMVEARNLFIEDPLDDRAYYRQGSAIRVKCLEGFARSDLDQDGHVRTGAEDTAVCNRNREGGYLGRWGLDMTCRPLISCASQPLDGDGPEEMNPDGTSGCSQGSCDGFSRASRFKAYQEVDGKPCECQRGEEPVDIDMCLRAKTRDAPDLKLKCSLPAGRPGASIAMRCAPLHGTSDGSEETSARCNDGKWVPEAPCELQLGPFENFIMHAFFWLAVLVLPVCCCCGYCCGCCVDYSDRGSMPEDGDQCTCCVALCCCGGCFGMFVVPVLALALFFLSTFIGLLPLLAACSIGFLIASCLWYAVPAGPAQNLKELSDKSFKEFCKATFEFLVCHIGFNLVHICTGFLCWNLDLMFAIANLAAFFPNFEYHFGIEFDIWNLPELQPFRFLRFVYPDFDFKLPGIRLSMSFLKPIINLFGSLHLDIFVTFRCDASLICISTMMVLGVEIFVVLISASSLMSLFKVNSLCAKFREDRFQGSRLFKKFQSFVISGISTACSASLVFLTQNMLLAAQRSAGDFTNSEVLGACGGPGAAIATGFARVVAVVVVAMGLVIFLYSVNGYFNFPDALVFLRVVARRFMCCSKRLLNGFSRGAAAEVPRRPASHSRAESEPPTPSQGIAPPRPPTHDPEPPPGSPPQLGKQRSWKLARMLVSEKLMGNVAQALWRPWTVWRSEKDPFWTHPDDPAESGLAKPSGLLQFIPVTVGIWMESQFYAYIKADACIFDCGESWTAMAQARAEVIALLWQTVPVVGFGLSKLTQYANQHIIFTFPDWERTTSSSPQNYKDVLEGVDYNPHDINSDLITKLDAAANSTADGSSDNALFRAWRMHKVSLFVRWLLSMGLLLILVLLCFARLNIHDGMCMAFWAIVGKVILNDLASKLSKNIYRREDVQRSNELLRMRLDSARRGARQGQAWT